MTRFLSAALAAVLVLAGCDAAGPDGSADAPTPPPASAFSFDGDFPDGSARSAAGAHFLNAAGRYVIVSAVVGAHLIVPKAVTEAATSAEPVVEDGTWIWATTTAVNGSDVTFRLEGTPEGQEVDWRLRITSVDGGSGEIAEDFDLYTATTSLDGRRGSWALQYLIDGEPTEVLTADFEVRAEDGRELTFRVPQVRPAGGSSVAYRVDGEAFVFDWLRMPEDEQTTVRWDRATGAGSIEADAYNGGDRACWDEDQNDAACPSA